jgi:hypothetical protein
MRASASCSRAVCRRSEQRLNGSDMGLVLEQVASEAVAQRMQERISLERERMSVHDPGCGTSQDPNRK